MKTARYRILTLEGKIKFAGTGLDSWFFSLETAKKNTNYSEGDSIYEYNHNGDRLWEVL
jgi:hypothetical protein